METPPPPRTAADYAAASALFCLHRTTTFYTLPAPAAPGAPHPDLQAAQTLYALATTPAVDDMETEDDDAAGAKNRGVGYGEVAPACAGLAGGGAGKKKKKGRVYPTPEWTGSEEGVGEGQEQVGAQTEGGAVVTKSGRQSKRPKRWGG